MDGQTSQTQPQAVRTPQPNYCERPAITAARVSMGAASAPTPTPEDLNALDKLLIAMAKGTTEHPPAVVNRQNQQPPQPPPPTLAPAFHSSEVESRMSRYAKDYWTSADNIAYNMAASKQSVANAAPSAYAMIQRSGGIQDLKERLSIVEGDDLRTMMHRIAAGMVADQVLIGQFAMMRLSDPPGGPTVDMLERMAAVKSGSDDAALKAMAFVDKLRNPPAIPIRTAQLNVANTQQVLNAGQGGVSSDGGRKLPPAAPSVPELGA